MKKMRLALLIALAALALTATLCRMLLAALVAHGQGEELTLRLSRDFGYGGLGGDIQGTFTIKAGGPAGLARVEFYIDETKIGEATGAPFNLQFVTDNYPPGAHSLSAVGYTSDGQELRSKPIGATFVSPSDASKIVTKILVPLLVLIGVAILLSFALSMFTGRKLKSLPPGAPRSYSLGGGICPKCGRPVAFQVFGMNVVVGKLQRCPYCGRWSVLRRAPLDLLRAAEQAEVEAAAGQAPAVSEEERLRKQLEDSKYQGL